MTHAEDELQGESTPLMDTEREGAPPGKSAAESSFGIHELLYAANSFCAVLKPVSLTMLLASVVVVMFQEDDGTDGSSGAGSALDAYTVYDETGDSSDTTTVRLEKSMVNALLIVCVLAAATFGIVCLYKHRCMKLLVGYMMLSSIMLLGLMGGVLWSTVLEKWQLPCDAFTYYLTTFNFAVVGVVSIFFQKGIPTVVTQGYLVCTSVLMAWQLSKFEEWTGWCLLVVLALYDLCAVLTPCGPLKALVTLMQERNEPMPGLLYEAELPDPTPAPTPAPSRPSPPRRTVAGSAAHQPPPQPLLREPPELLAGKGGHRLDGFVEAEAPGDAAVAEPQDRSIKLGLGDFVFYSVLVSRAALYGFATCAVCFLVIISGLGATLVLLSVFQKALPALPISIGLGVAFYFLTRTLIIPFVEALAGTPIFV